jgi:hypothetical protein
MNSFAKTNPDLFADRVFRKGNDLPTHFRLAFFGSLKTSSYPNGSQWENECHRWWIIMRRGQCGEIITIGSHADAKQDCDMPFLPKQAPRDLQTPLTRCALVVANRTRQIEFLFLRNLPKGIDVEGHFEPAEGYGRLELVRRTLLFTSYGRSATNHEIRGGQIFLTDVSNPPDGFGQSSYIIAKRRRWEHDVIVD